MTSKFSKKPKFRGDSVGTTPVQRLKSYTWSIEKINPEYRGIYSEKLQRLEICEFMLYNPFLYTQKNAEENFSILRKINDFNLYRV